MKQLFSFGLFLIFVLTAHAQVCDCPEIPGFKRDFCYANPLFPKSMAQFKMGATFFYFQSASMKKPIQIGLNEKGKLEYMLEIANNKSLKLKATDILFIQEALGGWASSATDLLVKSIGANKRTAEDLAKLALQPTNSGLGFQLLQAGKGKQAEAGKKVKVHYRGYLTNGEVFDASFDRGDAFEFTLGRGQVIKGWDEGIAKMKVGDHAVFRIPSALGYGPRAVGKIPANSELLFEVLLIGAE